MAPKPPVITRWKCMRVVTTPVDGSADIETTYAFVPTSGDGSFTVTFRGPATGAVPFSVGIEYSVTVALPV